MTTKLFLDICAGREILRIVLNIKIQKPQPTNERMKSSRSQTSNSIMPGPSDIERRDRNTEARCECGQLMAKLLEDGIELKCKRCRRIVLIPFAAIEGWEGMSPS